MLSLSKHEGRAALAAIVVFSTLGPAVAADRLSLDGPMTQGALIVGTTEPGARVTLDGRRLRVSKEGYFVIGLGRDAKAKSVLRVVHADGRKQARTLKISKRKYDVQRIKGLPKRKVSPSKKDMVRIRKDSARIRAVRDRYGANLGYRGGFAWPVRGRISGVYGSQRILNGEARRPHSGVDVAAPTGTPVAAIADGVAALADAGMFFTGNTVMIDHGHGVTSVYAHLSKLLVKQGQAVRKGQRIGLIGATGRVTGPHLHWGVSVARTAVDPALLVGPMPK
jgi:murein DD-endopeptidase MepM/ murein hydrolase activator NlpD